MLEGVLHRARSRVDVRGRGRNRNYRYKYVQVHTWGGEMVSEHCSCYEWCTTYTKGATL